MKSQIEKKKVARKPSSGIPRVIKKMALHEESMQPQMSQEAIEMRELHEQHKHLVQQAQKTKVATIKQAYDRIVMEAAEEEKIEIDRLNVVAQEREKKINWIQFLHCSTRTISG